MPKRVAVPGFAERYPVRKLQPTAFFAAIQELPEAMAKPLRQEMRINVACIVTKAGGNFSVMAGTPGEAICRNILEAIGIVRIPDQQRVKTPPVD